MLVAVIVSVALGHGGVVHDTSRGCPGSIFAGAAHADYFYALDWQAQMVYIVDRHTSAEMHRWTLPPSYWYAIAQHSSGAMVVANNKTCIITEDTDELTWTPLEGCTVHKLRQSGGVYYGLNVLTGQMFTIPSCEEVITTPPSDYVADKDGVLVWSFDIGSTTTYYIGDNGKATIQTTMDTGTTWHAIPNFDAWSGHRPPTYISHHYGDIFYDQGRLLAVTGEVCYHCENAQSDGNAGKVVEVIPNYKILAAGLRHPYMNALVGNLLLIGDVGASSYEELNVFDVSEPTLRNFMWPLYEGTHVFYKDSRYYGGQPQKPVFVLDHCDHSDSVMDGAYLSISASAVVLSAIAYAGYKRRIISVLFKVVVGVGVTAPVWYTSNYGQSYYEGIIYAVEDHHLISYKPYEGDYVIWAALVVAIILPRFGGLFSLPFVIWLTVGRSRNGPFSINIPYLGILAVAIVTETIHEINVVLHRTASYSKLSNNEMT